MVKANIETASGAKIVIEGSSEEVSDIIDDLQNREKRREERLEFIRRMRKRTTKEYREKRNAPVHKSRTSITDVLIKLIKEGFFDNPKRFREISNRLEREGIFIPSSTVHPVLSRLVAHGKLKREKGEEDFWEYAKND